MPPENVPGGESSVLDGPLMDPTVARGCHVATPCLTGLEVNRTSVP